MSKHNAFFGFHCARMGLQFSCFCIDSASWCMLNRYLIYHQMHQHTLLYHFLDKKKGMKRCWNSEYGSNSVRASAESLLILLDKYLKLKYRNILCKTEYPIVRMAYSYLKCFQNGWICCLGNVLLIFIYVWLIDPYDSFCYYFWVLWLMDLILLRAEFEKVTKHSNFIVCSWAFVVGVFSVVHFKCLQYLQSLICCVNNI